MLRALSRVEQLFRETLLHRAKGEAFLRLAARYGFTKPKYIAEESWRAAVISSAFNARGTPGVIFNFLETVFSEWIDELSTFSAVATAVNILEIQDADCNLESRFIRIDGELHRSANLRPGYPNELVLVPVTTSMFKGARLTPGETYTVKVLPFDIEEHSCKYRILLDAGVLQYPSSYIREDASARTNDPDGAHLLDFFSEVLAERFGNQETGAYPIYLSAEEFSSLFFDSLDLLLAAGVKEEIALTPWCDEASIYGSIYNRKVYGTVSPNPPPLIVPTRS